MDSENSRRLIKEAQDALKRVAASESRYRSLTDTIPQLMWTATPDGNVNYANERCLHYTGLSSQEKYGEGWVGSIHPEDLARVGHAWQTSMMAGYLFKAEYRIRRHDGIYHWFSGRAIPIRNANDEIEYWIGTATDIEEEKQRAEELKNAKEVAEQANRAKSAFLANMSHEIRTPLAAILGFSGLLKDEFLTQKERNQFVEIVERNGKSLTRIIDDILDLAKVESGLLEMEAVSFSFSELLGEVAEVFYEKAFEKNIYLTFNVHPDVPDQIISDPTRLRQILMNIIGNAVKFTDKGGIHISTTAARNKNDLLKFDIEIKDTGCGLTEEQSKKLFQPFTQADNTTTRRFGGTGLGLSLSKRLSQALGGDISIIECGVDKGCTFRVSFLAKTSVQQSRFEGKSIVTPIKKSEDSPLSGVSILLVDDSEENQLLVKNILTKNGASVELASNGVEAVKMANENPHHVVLMDIQMPLMDGYQATRSLISMGYKTPIIALTAHAMLEDRAKTKAAGFSAHLTKPIQYQELLNTIISYSRDT